MRAIRIPVDLAERIYEVEVAEDNYQDIGAAIMGPDASPCFIERVEAPRIRALGYPGPFSYEAPSIEMWLKEEGLFEADPQINERATVLAGEGYHLVGPAILLGSAMVEVPEEGYFESAAVSLPSNVTVRRVEAVCIAAMFALLRDEPQHDTWAEHAGDR